MKYILVVFMLVFGLESFVLASSKKKPLKGKREIASHTEKHKKHKKSKKSKVNKHHH